MFLQRAIATAAFFFVILALSPSGISHAALGRVDTPGYARDVHVSGSYAYVADDFNGLVVVDITTPTAPAIVGWYDTPGNANAVFVSGSYAYLTVGWQGLTIIDVSNPGNPTLAGSLSFAAPAEDVFVAGSYAYVAAGNRGLIVINIASPASPVQVGSYDPGGYSEGVFVSGGYAYVTNGEDGLRIINVSNPADPTLARTVDTPGYAEGVFVAPPYAYVADQTQGVQVVNISNPSTASIVGNAPAFGISNAVFVSGTTLFVADDYGGLGVYDVLDPTKPVPLGRETTVGSTNGVFVSGPYAYTADYDFGLAVMDTRKYFNVALGFVDTPGNAVDVTVDGSYAYVADSGSGVQVIHVANPKAPFIAASIPTPGIARAVDVSGSYLYVADSVGGFLVFNVDNPLGAFQTGCLVTPGSPKGIFVSGSCAYVADGSGSGLQVVDVSDPENPAVIGSLLTSGSAEDVYVDGTRAYLADGGGGMRIIDVTNPQTPFLVGTAATSGTAYEVRVAGSYAYVAASSEALQIVDISDPFDPFVYSALETDDPGKGIRLAGSYGYLANGASGLQVLDLLDPEYPGFINTVATPGIAGKVELQGGVAYVADGSKGLRLIDISMFPCGSPKPQAPAEIAYAASDSDGSFPVSWSPVAGAAKYSVQRAPNVSFLGAVSVYDGPATSFNQAGLCTGTYYYRVSAANDCGRSNWKAGPAITVNSCPQAPPSIIYPATDCDGTFTVTWQPGAGAATYVLERAAAPSFAGATALYSGPATTWEQKGLAGGTYYYRVRSVNGQGVSKWRAGPAIVIQGVPGIPVSLTTPATTCSTAVAVSWGAATGASGYVLQRATIPSFADAATIYSGPAASFTDTVPAPGTYYYRIQATNACGNSDWRNGSAVTVNAPPPVPGSLTTPPSSCNGTVAVSWEAVSRATSYTLQRANNSGFSGAVTVYSGSALSYQDTALPLGTYYYRLLAANACGNSEWKTGAAVAVATTPSAPGSLSYPSTTCDASFTVSWGAVSGATGYILQRATRADFGDASQVFSGNATTTTETAPPPGTYYYRVAAVNDCGTGAWKSAGAIVVSAPPAAPTSITAPASNCSGSFTVSWSAAANATGYVVQRSTDPGFISPVQVYSGTALSYVESGLAAGTYYYRVRSTNGCGNSDWRVGGTVLVTGTLAAPATLTHPTDSCSGSFEVSWSSVTGATAYVLQRATLADFSNAVPVYTGTNTAFSQTGLAAGVYYYRVAVQNDCGTGPWKTGTAVTVVLVLNTPASLTLPAANCGGSFSISWASVAGATGYVLQRATQADFSNAVQVYSGASPSYAETGLTAGTYYYRVAAVNACTSSGWKSNGGVVVTVIPPAPASLSIPSSSCGGNFTVSWPGAAGATSYTLQRADNSGFTGAVTVYSGSATSYQEGTLTAGTYYYRVRAANTCGNSAWKSNGGVAVATTPSAPGTLSYPSATCDASLALSWGTVSDATGYILQRATRADFGDASQVFSGKATTTTETGLPPGTYYYRVAAVNDCGTGAWKSAGAIVVSTVPAAPTGITAPAVSCSGSFTVSWPAVPGASSYLLHRSTDPDFAVNVSAVYGGSATSYEQSGLTIGEYYYRVQARNDCGGSAWVKSSRISVTTEPAPPSSITYPAANCGGSFQVSWPNAYLASGYILQRADNATFVNAATVYSGTSNTFDQTGLRAGTYYYRVQAVNDCGSTAWTNGGAIAVAAAPAAPATISYPASASSGSFTVSWATVTGASGYTLQRATGSAFSDPTTVYSGPGAVFEQTGLPNGTYYYRVRADHACGSSAWTAGGPVTVGANRAPVVAGPPSGPAVAKVGAGTKFTVQASDPDGDSLLYRLDWGDGKRTGWITPNYATHKWLASGTYCVKAQAKDSKGAQSSWSPCGVLVVSRPPVVAGAPSGPDSGKVGMTYKFTGSASDPDGESVEYRFSWGDGTTSSWAANPVRSRKWTAAGTYCVKVQARDPNGLTSPWSACKSVQIVN